MAIVLAGGAPADSPAEVLLQPVGASNADPLQVGQEAAPGYVIVDIPAFNRTGANPEHRDADLTANLTRTELGSAVRTGATTSPGRIGVQPLPPEHGAAFHAAVVAAHDDRITLLKQRIDQAQTDQPGDNVLLRDLTARLERANAARRLSAERAMADQACCETVGRPATDEPVASGAAASTASAGVAAVHRVSVPMAAADIEGPMPSRLRLREPVSMTAAHEPAALPDIATRAFDRQPPLLALERSRAALATARALLADDGASRRMGWSNPGAMPIGWGWPSPIIQFVLALTALLIVLAAAHRRPGLSPATS